MDGQGTKWCRSVAENFNRLSRVHERYRQIDDRHTDGRATAYSERESEFTFAKNSFRPDCILHARCFTNPFHRVPLVFIRTAITGYNFGEFNQFCFRCFTGRCTMVHIAVLP